MKDTGFLALLNRADLNVENAGFMKDQFGRRGVSSKITIGETDYAIWFMQKNFPEGIYTIALTALKACMVFPMYKYYEGRDMVKVIEFIDELKNDNFDNPIEDIVHPWTELKKRIDLI